MGANDSLGGSTGTFAGGAAVLKALVGGSYAWDASGGLFLLGEDHFSGFGVRDLAALYTAPHRERLLRGDAHILGRHAGALQALWGGAETGTIAE